eukprot:g1452.t1
MPRMQRRSVFAATGKAQVEQTVSVLPLSESNYTAMGRDQRASDQMINRRKRENGAFSESRVMRMLEGTESAMSEEENGHGKSAESSARPLERTRPVQSAAALQRNIEHLSQVCRRDKKQIVELKKIVAKLRENIDEKNLEIENARKAAKKHALVPQSLEQKNPSPPETVDNSGDIVERQLLEMEEVLAQERRETKRLKDALAAEIYKGQRTKESLDQIKAERNEAQAKHMAAKNEIENIITAKEELSKAYNLAQEKLKQLEATLQGSEKENSQYTSDLKSAAFEADKARARLRNLQRDYEISERRRKEAASSSAKAVAENLRAQAERSQVEAQLARTEAEVAELSKRLTMGETEMKKFQDCKEELRKAKDDMMRLLKFKARCKDLEKASETLKSEMGEMRRAAEAAQSSVNNSTRNAIAEMDREKNALEKIINDQALTLTDLEGKLKESTASTQSLRSELLSTKEQLNTLQKSIDMEDFEKRRKALEDSLADTVSAKNELELRLQAMIEERDHAMTRAMAAEAECGRILPKLNELEVNAAENKNLKARLSKLERRVDSEKSHLEAELQAMIIREQQLLQSSQQHEKDAKSAHLALEQEKQRYGRLESQLVTINARRQVHIEEIQRLEAALSESESTCAGLEKDILAYSERCSSLEKAAGDSEANAALAKSLKATEKELSAVVHKLVAAEEASESAFTCLSCMQLFEDPVTCIPCGHTFCRKCASNCGLNGDAKSSSKGKCIECVRDRSRESKDVDYFIENQLLENLAARYVFRKQALSSIKKMISLRRDSTE